MSKHEDIPTTDPAQIEQLIERLKRTDLEPHEMQLLERVLRTFLSLVSLLQHKNASIRKLKQMIFGPKTERRKAGDKKVEDQADSATSDPEQNSPEEPVAETNANSALAAEAAAISNEKPNKPGHGRKKPQDYTGAKVIRLNHTHLQAGDACPDPACRGHLHRLKEPAPKIYLTGQPIVAATRYEREVLRCTNCQDYFRAELPEGVAEGKYDPTADVAIVQVKYGAGIPFYRLARLQEACGVPLPESVQFERCEAVANVVLPVYKYLLALAADGKLFHTDDTRVVILACVREDKRLEEGEKRRATLTSGIVIKSELWVIALYLSGRRHAGENLDRVLEQRSAGLPTPIQMADAQSANWSRKSETIESKCLTHGRRKFTDIEESFPFECDEVLLAIAKVYRFEAETKGMIAPDQVFMAELNGAHYERQGDESCIASVIAEESSLALWWEPASFLSAVIGADEAGSETVNGVPAEHYTFDQRALGLADFTSSTGEVWVASDGGYVVKYVLVTEAGADYFGEGSEGALSWVYDLTDANLPAAIELPVDCPAGMIDAPLLPDAAIVLNVPGLLSYTTPASLEDAAAFYEVELPALGWQPVASPGIAETSVMLDFAQGDQQLSVIITAAGALTTIRLVLRRVIIP